MAVGLPLKTTYADGDVYSASDVNDTNGTINAYLAPSLGYSAGKNKIINGDFSINQRAFTSATTDGTYTFDRWRISRSGGGTLTATPQTFTVGAAPVTGYEGKNFVQLVTASQSLTGDYATFNQPIEDVRTFANQTVVVSFWAKAASGTPKIGIELNQYFGTGGSPSAEVNVPAGAVTLSTSWARYSASVAVPSLSGKTIGTNNNSYLSLQLWVSAGATFNTRASSIGNQNNTFQIWGAQVEASSTATAFQTATGTIQGELAACQRYYYRAGDGTQAYPLVASSGWITNSTTCAGFMNFPVRLRALPSAIDYSNLQIQDANLSSFNVTAVSSDTATFSGNNIGLNFFASGMTSARFARVLGNNSTSAYLALSSEL